MQIKLTASNFKFTELDAIRETLEDLSEVYSIMPMMFAFESVIDQQKKELPERSADFSLGRSFEIDTPESDITQIAQFGITLASQFQQTNLLITRNGKPPVEVSHVDLQAAVDDTTGQKRVHIVSALVHQHRGMTA